jgi:hypothetical protein
MKERKEAQQRKESPAATIKQERKESQQHKKGTAAMISSLHTT